MSVQVQVRVATRLRSLGIFATCSKRGVLSATERHTSLSQHVNMCSTSRLATPRRARQRQLAVTVLYGKRMACMQLIPNLYP